MYSLFQESYYEIEKYHPLLDPSTFMSGAPIIVIDILKQNYFAIALSIVDVRIKHKAIKYLTELTTFCLLTHLII